MRGEASPEEILHVVSVVSGCNASACSDRSCICKAQVSALSMSFRVIRKSDQRRSKFRRKYYTEAEISLIVEMHRSGATISKIAERVGRSALSVWQKVRDLRVKGRISPARKVDMHVRAQAAFDFIRSFMAEHGHPPTYKQIGQAIGVNHKSQITQVMRLLRAGGSLRTARAG